MKHVTLLIVGLLVGAVGVLAQPDSVLIKHYTFSEYDVCRALCQTDDGGFLLAGYRGSGVATWILKTDQNGDSLWSVFCRTGILCNSMQKTDDGGFVLAGHLSVDRDTGPDFHLLRLDENGETVWSRTYGTGINESDVCYDMIQTRSGGYALAGYTYTVGIPSNEVLLLITDEEGDSLWSRTYDMPTWPNRVTMLQRDDGGFLLAGFNFLLRTAENGDSLWSTEIPFNFEDMALTEDGGIIVSGGFTDGRGYSQLMKLDQNCDTLWSKDYGYFGLESHNSVIETEDHGFLVTGEQNGDLVAVRTDENGDSLWSSIYFGGHSGCNTVIRTSEGGFAFGGYLETLTGHNYLFIKSNDEPFSIENPFDPPFHGVAQQRNQVPPTELSLLSSYPNPFNSSTTISYSLPKPGRYALDVVDIQGRLVTRLSDGWKPAGSYHQLWNAGLTASGTYRVVLKDNLSQRNFPVTLIK